MTWTRAASLDDLWDGEMAGVHVAGRDVLLCHLDGQVYAYDDRCPHQANPLSAGSLRDGVLTCAAHEWMFNIRTGAGINPVAACLTDLPVRMDGDWVLVDCREDAAMSEAR